jgi:hypothetical protein
MATNPHKRWRSTKTATISEKRTKVGLKLYKFHAYYDYDNKRVETGIETWYVRSIRRRPRLFSWSTEKRSQYVNMTRYECDITWVRLSKKVGHYGWSNYIPKSHKDSFRVGEPIPSGFFTTELAAMKDELADCKKALIYWTWETNNNSRDAEDEAENQEVVDEYVAKIKVIKSRMTRDKNKKAKK